MISPRAVLATPDSTTSGRDYRPDVAEDQVMAAALAPTIASKIGW